MWISHSDCGCRGRKMIFFSSCVLLLPLHIFYCVTPYLSLMWINNFLNIISRAMMMLGIFSLVCLLLGFIFGSRIGCSFHCLPWRDINMACMLVFFCEKWIYVSAVVSTKRDQINVKRKCSPVFQEENYYGNMNEQSVSSLVSYFR